MKILLIGSVIFSKFIFNELIKKNYNLVGVCTSKNKKNNSDFFNLSKIAKKNSVPCKFINNINSTNTFEWIKSKKPDLIICCGWSQIIKKNILKVPTYGCIGYHPSDLPRNRGRSPIIWTIFLGLKFCGSTFFKMTEEADKGEILSKKKIKVYPNDDATIIYKKLCLIGVKQIHISIKKVKTSKFKTNYKKNITSNFWRKRKFSDGKIDWRMSSTKIDKLVKALAEPYPNAHFIYKNKIVKVLKSKKIKHLSINIEPGKIILIKNKKIIVKCGEGAILLRKIFPNVKFKINTYLD